MITEARYHCDSPMCPNSISLANPQDAGDPYQALPAWGWMVLPGNPDKHSCQIHAVSVRRYGWDSMLSGEAPDPLNPFEESKTPESESPT